MGKLARENDVLAEEVARLLEENGRLRVENLSLQNKLMGSLMRAHNDAESFASAYIAAVVEDDAIVRWAALCLAHQPDGSFRPEFWHLDSPEDAREFVRFMAGLGPDPTGKEGKAMWAKAAQAVYRDKLVWDLGCDRVRLAALAVYAMMSADKSLTAERAADRVREELGRLDLYASARVAALVFPEGGGGGG